ncbi:MAG: YceI family protein [Hyphomonadaceae bacterium]
MRSAAFAAAFALAAFAASPLPAFAQGVPAELPAAEGTSLNPADAPAGAYRLDNRHASVVWRVRHMGLGIYTARFDTVNGALQFDPQNPTNSSINVTIAANSVSTGLLNDAGERAFDREISNVLGAEANPEIRFVSTAVQVTGPTTGLITGDLTLNGQTHPVTLEARFHGGRHIALRNRHVIAFAGRTIIQRSQWGAGNAIWNQFVGDEVEILVDAEFIKE